MRKTARALSLFVTCLLPLSLIISTPISAKDIRMACSTWFPFVGEDLPHMGFYTRMVVEAGKKVGINIKPEVMPWKRVVALTKSGLLDGALCPVITEERRQWLVYADEGFISNEIGFFARKDNPVASVNFEDLTQKQLGALSASVYLKELLANGLNAKGYPDNEMGFRMLAGRRFDAIYQVKITGDYLFRTNLKHLADQIYYVGPTKAMIHSPALSKKHPQAKELALRLGEGYRIMEQDGTLDKILSEANMK